MTQQGIKYQQSGDYEKAIECYKSVLEQRSDNVSALTNLGVALHHINKTEEGLSYIDKALTISRNNPDIMYNKAELLRMSDHFEKALQCYSFVLTAQQPTATHIFNMGCCKEGLGLYQQALVDYQKAFSMRHDPKFLYRQGVVLSNIGSSVDAINVFLQALDLDPNYVKVLLSLGKIFKGQNPAQANEYFNKVLTLEPNNPRAMVGIFNANMAMCNWAGYDEQRFTIKNAIEKALENNEQVPMDPFEIMSLNLGYELQVKTAVAGSLYLQTRLPRREHYDFLNRDNHNRSIRVGFISSDIRKHAMAHLISSLFTHFDRNKIQIYMYTHSRDDESAYRQTILDKCDHWVDCFQWTDKKIADEIYKDQIDILVDLNGYTASHRLMVLAFKPAPIQVTYMGYPGTTGAKFVDYLIADKIVVPGETYDYFTEKIVTLPDCYLSTDDQQAISRHKGLRHDHGLPEDKFILCSMNSAYKIDPGVFDSWINVLNACEHAVLWMYATKEETRNNIIAYASQRGLDRRKIIFASPERDKSRHLARLAHADLVLDAFVVNGITTSVDALWAKVPVITCMGSTFQQRAAASILNGIGLSELVTTSMQEYKETIIHYVNNKQAHQQLNEKIAENRKTQPLFNTNRIAKHLEKAFELMWQRYQEGLSPTAINVPKIESVTQICDIN